jgi:hypothetical protein
MWVSLGYHERPLGQFGDGLALHPAWPLLTVRLV